MPNEFSTQGETDPIISILGSGTCVPSLKRSACSALMETGGKNLLFDCGPGTMRRLLEAGKRIFDISYLFFSHFHPDHIGELVTFLFATKYPDINQRQIPLTIIAAKGFISLFNKLKEAYGPWMEFSLDMVRIIELEITRRDTASFGSFDLQSIPVNHRPESLAYRITTHNGRSIVYSGDTDYSENLISLSRKADLLILESAYPDELKVQGHLTPSLAGEIASRSAVRKLVLTHLYPECDEVDMAKECRKSYTGPLAIAEDLMKIPLD